MSQEVVYVSIATAIDQTKQRKRDVRGEARLDVPHEWLDAIRIFTSGINVFREVVEYGHLRDDLLTDNLVQAFQISLVLNTQFASPKDPSGDRTSWWDILSSQGPEVGSRRSGQCSSLPGVPLF
jgi:hypothetical protein